MKLYSTTWFSVFALVLLAACQNHQSPPTPGTPPTPAVPTSPQFRIKQATMQSTEKGSPLQGSTNRYSYDSQGRLDSIYTYYYNRARTSYEDLYYYTVFRYDRTGKLIRVDYLPYPGTVYTYRPAHFDYTYDANGNAVLIKYIPDSAIEASSKSTFKLEYNGTKFPVKITDTNEQFMTGSVMEYIYEQGNVARLKKYYFDNIGRVINPFLYSYQFDDKPNPFYGLYIGAPNPEMFADYTFKRNSFYQSNTFNKNNFIESDTKYDYSYDSTGHLVKIGSKDLSTTFTYEKY